MQFFKRLSMPVLVGLAVAASTLPKAHGQSRSVHMRPSALTRTFTLNRTTIRQMRPIRSTMRPMTPVRSTMRPMTPVRTTIRPATPLRTPTRQTTPSILHRDLRFDPILRRDLRLGRFFGAGSSGFLRSAGTSFGSPSAFSGAALFGAGGLGSAAIASSGLTPYPVPYPVYANPYADVSPYDFPGGADGANREDRSSGQEERQGSQREQLNRSPNNPR
jgi:hypothetical protein